MRTPWQKDGLSTDPPSITMGAKDKRSFEITAPAPANVASATALLRDLTDSTTTAIESGDITAAASKVTVLVDGEALQMVGGKTYRLEVQFVRSTGLEETARLVIECPA